MTKEQKEVHDFGAELGTLVTNNKGYATSASYSEDLLRYQTNKNYDKCYQLITELALHYNSYIPTSILTLTSETTEHEKVLVLYAYMMGFHNASLEAKKKKK